MTPQENKSLTGVSHDMKAEKEELEKALDDICQNRKSWLFLLFVLAASPGILNGMHINSYVFMVNNEPFWCAVPQLQRAGWSADQIRNISVPKNESNEDHHRTGCQYYDWPYSELANLSQVQAFVYVQSEPKPAIVPCLNGYTFQDPTSAVSQWNLVCDRFYYRSNIQAAYATGKFFGSSVFGIIADKAGRKFGFTLVAWCFAASVPLAFFSGTFFLFLFGRFVVGFAGGGSYGIAFTLLSEMTVGSAKTWTCNLFNVSYPIGMILLSIVAYYFHHWNTLLIIISAPAILLPLYRWFLPESPHWLLSKKRTTEAWMVIESIDSHVVPRNTSFQLENQDGIENEGTTSFLEKIESSLKEFFSMFSSKELMVRSMICYYSWFTFAIAYFGLVLNGDNFNLNRYVYVMLLGVLEMVSYAVPIPILSVCGRRYASASLLLLTSIMLISIVAVPKGSTVIILMMAIGGRTILTSAYVIFILYTSELFPTSIRNTAMGTSITMSHVGTFVSPYIVDILGTYKWYLPSTLFGVLAFMNVFLVLLLPETKDQALFNTIDEMKNSGQHS